jgi:radical SAM protein with 4Fe4S-binding SPASM domain
MEELSLDVRVWMALQLLPDRVEKAAVVGAMIEAGAICNLRCPFCPTGNGELALSKEFLEPAQFKAMLDALGPQVKRLMLYNWGESLLNPAIYEMFAEAAARGIATTVSTNFSLGPAHFSRAHAERLVRSGLAELQVSFGGVTQETYGLYRVGGRLELVLENLRLLLDAKRRLGAELPAVVWLFHVHRQNQADVPRARALADELGIPIRFKTLVFPDAVKDEWGIPEPAPAPPPARGSRRTRAASGPKASGDGRQPVVRGRLCLQTRDTPIVHSDGTVLPCCVVNNPEYSLGNIREESLDAIWNKPLIAAMRRYLRTGERPGMKLPCYGCPHEPARPSKAP